MIPPPQASANKASAPRVVIAAGPDEGDPDQSRMSVAYQAREMSSARYSQSKRRSEKSAVFDTVRIGTATKHGIAPLPGGRGYKGKINQDRGLVCWPFAGSTAQALFCIFDGHGRRGELVSEFCMGTSASQEQRTISPRSRLRERVIALRPPLSR